MEKTDNNPKVSVVVPIYNVERYLSMCVNSIIDQTYRNLEVILVDDKTPDNSGKIADEYAEKDLRIKVIHKPKNEGLNMARATGFAASTGEYVMFVDSDDFLVQDCIKTALAELYDHSVDFVKFNFARFKDDDSLSKLQKDTLNQSIEKRRIVRGKRDLYKTRFVNDIVGESTVCVWGGLYASKVLRSMDWKQSNYRIYEDNFWMMQLFDLVDSGVYISKTGYFYRSDDSYQGVLSKALTGNSYNGEPVGYLEFVKKYFEKFRHYNNKYALGLDRDIELLETWTWIDKLSTLSKADKLYAENNADFLPTAIGYLVQQYEDKKALNEERKHELMRLKKENEKLRREIKSFHSVKRSARLLAGNIKRKISSSKR